MTLKDSYGRPLINLRLAVTRRCNLRCQYCHGEGEEKHEGNFANEMTTGEIVRIVKIAVKMGISKVKLTGGEPLMREDITEIVKEIAAIPGVKDLSMTTNGTMLAPLAEELRKNGLKRVNINLPTINEETYNKLTGGKLENVLEGVKSAVEAGLCPVKINMLILKGVNDDDVPEMIEFASGLGTTLQLIELEPINVSEQYYLTHYKPLNDYEEMLKQKATSIEVRQYMQMRRIYHLPKLDVEVVHPIENTDFCMHCTRLRVTSDGKLKPCLMRNDNLVDILTSIRKGADDEELIELFKVANMRRQPFNKTAPIDCFALKI